MCTMLEHWGHVLETHFSAEQERSPQLDPLQQKPINILSLTGKLLEKVNVEDMFS